MIGDDMTMSVVFMAVVGLILGANIAVIRHLRNRRSQ